MKSKPKSSDEAIQDLIRDGAALLFVAFPTDATAVAWWRRIDAKRHFWHACGTSDFDHHVLRFDREEVIYDGDQVVFFDKAGELIAGLGLITEQEDDPERQKRLAEQIAWWREEYDRNEYFRKNIMEAFREAESSQ